MEILAPSSARADQRHQCWLSIKNGRACAALWPLQQLPTARRDPRGVSCA